MHPPTPVKGGGYRQPIFETALDDALDNAPGNVPDNAPGNTPDDVPGNAREANKAPAALPTTLGRHVGCAGALDARP